MKARIIDTGFGGVYSVEFIQENEKNNINGELVSTWTLTDKIPDSALIKPIWNGTVWVESISDAEIQEIEIEKATDKEFKSYLKRKSDGENAYLKLSAEFRLAKLSGQISEETHSYLEELLTPVRNEVMFGQWKKGLELLEIIGLAQVGEDLYNRLHSQISEYVSNNY